jgi:hypothetical protein
MQPQSSLTLPMPGAKRDELDVRVDSLYRGFLQHYGLERFECEACARVMLPAPFNLESYTYTARGGRTWTWDVGYARWLVQVRQPATSPQLVRAHELHDWLDHHTQLDLRHLEHIPPAHVREPVLRAPAPDGYGQVLIDGSHRAAARIRAHLPVHGFMLTETESALAVAATPFTMRAVHQALREQGLLPDSPFEQ